MSCVTQGVNLEVGFRYPVENVGELGESRESSYGLLTWNDMQWEVRNVEWGSNRKIERSRKGCFFDRAIVFIEMAAEDLNGIMVTIPIDTEGEVNISFAINGVDDLPKSVNIS